MNEEIKNLISAADKAIKEERFDDLMEFPRFTLAT